MTSPNIANAILAGVRLYHEHQRWCAHLFLLMPDHWHALMSFPSDLSMSRVIGDWKRYHARHSGVLRQEGYFDHRLRTHVEQLEIKAAYIRRNPVAAGFCTLESDWPWVWEPDDQTPDSRLEHSQR